MATGPGAGVSCDNGAMPRTLQPPSAPTARAPNRPPANDERVRRVVAALMTALRRKGPVPFRPDALRARLARDADRDRLTRLYLPDAFRERAAREVTTAMTERHAATLVLIDADGLAAINRTHGVLTGDRVLQNIADACIARLRGYDLVGRLDGPYLAVLLPGADTARARLVAESLRERVAALRLDTPSAGPPLQVRVSLGVAGLDYVVPDVDGDRALAAMVARAREALVGAKTAGGDRVVVDPPRDRMSGD